MKESGARWNYDPVSVDLYIVDFYCAEKKLVIELDGDGQKQGLTVIRFEKDELKENLVRSALRAIRY
jgi:very-short-patch-repair endonuclease